MSQENDRSKTPATPSRCRAGGKTRNAASTREAIIAAAQKRFIEDGYDQAGLRGIAQEAGIDAALISRYFGSKEGLFTEVLAVIGGDPMEILAGDRANFGNRVAQAMLDPSRCSSSRMSLISLITHSNTSPVASKLVHRHLAERFVRPVADWLGDERASEKAWLLASVLMGTAIVRDLGPGHELTEKRLARLLQSVIDD